MKKCLKSGHATFLMYDVNFLNRLFELFMSIVLASDRPPVISVEGGGTSGTDAARGLLDEFSSIAVPMGPQRLGGASLSITTFSMKPDGVVSRCGRGWRMLAPSEAASVEFSLIRLVGIIPAP